MNKQELMKKLENNKFKSPNSEYEKGYNHGLSSAVLTVFNLNYKTSDIIKELEEQQPFITNKTTPPHYQGTIQPIDLINAQNLNFNLGNVVKYVCRAGKKDGETTIKDFNKAIDYLNFEIERINNG